MLFKKFFSLKSFMNTFRQNIYNTSAPLYGHMDQNLTKCETGDSMHFEKQNEKEESHDIEQPRVIFNDSIRTESVSDIAEEKHDESVPQDISMISYYESQY